MNSIAKHAWSLFRAPASFAGQQQQWRGLRVMVVNGNVEQALNVLEKKMTSSGMERLIKRASNNQHHLKNSEKRILARKNLQRRLRSQDLARKLQSILIKKVRGL
eukprot:TRINITY_DN4816_c0_g2_i1.p1 TRINITY_DN4816_c0_g2~~TRINITY_DN4816_c0_g2_i1.p1  ORF type:complete len:105 (-),score=8.59 TRINITY_DN4816_c0_g2_i1:269-583(-)